MKTPSLTLHSQPVPPLALLKLQSAENKASSVSFAQYLTAHLNSTKASADSIASQFPVTSQNPVPVAPRSKTPDQLASQLEPVNQIPPSQPLQPINAPLYGGAYMQEITYNGFVNQANLQNQNAADQYQLNLSNWSLNETQRESLGLPSQPPPAAPNFVAVNNAGFNQWWSSLSNFGDPAPVTFINPIA